MMVYYKYMSHAGAALATLLVSLADGALYSGGVVLVGRNLPARPSQSSRTLLQPRRITPAGVAVYYFQLTSTTLGNWVFPGEVKWPLIPGTTRLPPRRTGFDYRRGRPGFSHVGIAPDDDAGRPVFSGFSRFPGAAPFHPHRRSRKIQSTENISIGSTSQIREIFQYPNHVPPSQKELWLLAFAEINRVCVCASNHILCTDIKCLPPVADRKQSDTDQDRFHVLPDGWAALRGDNWLAPVPVAVLPRQVSANPITSLTSRAGCLAGEPSISDYAKCQGACRKASLRNYTGAAESWWLVRSPPIKTNRVQSPAGSLPIFASGSRARRCCWSGGFIGDLQFPPALSFRRFSVLTSVPLIGSQDLAVKSRPNLFTHSLTSSSFLVITSSLIATSARRGEGGVAIRHPYLPFRRSHKQLRRLKPCCIRSFGGPRWLSDQHARLPPWRTGPNPRPGHRIFASENRAGRCRWSAGLLGDLPPPPPPPQFRRRSIVTPKTLIGSQDLAQYREVKRFGRLLTARSREPMKAIEVNMDRRRCEGAGEAGDHREDPPTNGIVRHGRGLSPVRLGGRRVPCFKGYYTEVRRQRCSAQSPDLNPMEHLWDELDRRVRARHGRPKSIAQLMAWLQEEWRRILVDVLQTLVESMPDRVAAVIAARDMNFRWRRKWEEIWAALNIEVLRTDEGDRGPRENPPTNGTVRHDSHMRKSGVTRPEIGPGSPLAEAEQANRAATVAPIAPRGLLLLERSFLHFQSRGARNSRRSHVYGIPTRERERERGREGEGSLSPTAPVCKKRHKIYPGDPRRGSKFSLAGKSGLLEAPACNPFAVTSSEALLKFYFQDMPPPRSN
ncbi:hypothetical protein PR048_029381 [Dryococelus australis]|uniref:Uncharacterized protein n=1 Tax=Dryococelus australis TaxID=614101 RepID=A0ABQ9GD74_9NEOP|nr:hypothetical protein PR048_029381 [Dryococelus australis]